jgi:5-methylcytosine-specific restriction endonuclease McrA
MDCKQCSHCMSIKPIDAFHRRGIGRTSWCKECISERNRTTRAANLDAAREYGRLRAAKWRAANPDRWREIASKSQRAKRGKDGDAVRAYHRRWAAANLDKVRRWSREWRLENPEAIREKSRRRRAALVSATCQRFTLPQLQSRLAAFGPACAYCGDDFDHIDHVKPLALGGPHMLANLRPACASCNLRKGAMSPQHWLAQVAPSVPLPLP